MAQTGPVAVNDTYNFSDTVITSILNVLANDSDIQNQPLFIAQVITTDNTLWIINLDSTKTYLIFAHQTFTCGSDSFAYVVCDTGKCDTGSVLITVNCPDNIFLPQGFSPNGDNINDLLVFTGVEYFEPASLKVFNRYGTLVFEDDNYVNNWDGTDGDSKNPLPDGTYFYRLQLSNNHIYNNYLVINR